MNFIQGIFVPLFLELNTICRSELLTLIVYGVISFVAVYFVAKKRLKNIHISSVFNVDFERIKEYGKSSYIKTDDQNKLLIASGYSVFANAVVWFVKIVFGLGLTSVFNASAYSLSKDFLFKIPFDKSFYLIIQNNQNMALTLTAVTALFMQYIMNSFVEKNVLVSNSVIDNVLLVVTIICFIFLPSAIIPYYFMVTLLELISLIVHSTLLWGKEVAKVRDSIRKEIDGYSLGLRLMSDDKKKKKKTTGKKRK